MDIKAVVLDYANPYTEGFQKATQKFQVASIGWKVAAVAAAIFAFVPFGVSSVAAFRVVMELSEESNRQLVADRIVLWIKKVFSFLTGSIDPDVLFSDLKPPQLDPKQANLLNFALFNTDFMDLNFGDLPTRHIHVLPWLIQELKALKHEDWIPEDELPILTRLISQYESAHELCLMIERVNQAIYDRPRLASEIKKAFKIKLLELLEKRKELMVSTGYRAFPHGHAVALYLNLSEEGRIIGKVINRGEGINYHHMTSYEGTAIKQSTYLDLESVSTEQLLDSPFFDYLLELTMVDAPRDPSISKKFENWSKECKTEYCIEDFYHVVLSAWPGAVILDPNAKARKGQRSGTCSLKPFMIALVDGLPKSAKHLKFRLNQRSLMQYVQLAGITVNNRVLVDEALKKLNRLAIKANIEGQEREGLAKYSSKIQKQLKKLKDLDLDKPSVGLPVDAATYRFKQSVEKMSIENGTSAKQTVNEELPPFERSHLESYMAQVMKMCKKAEESGQLNTARMFAISALETIPSSADDFWTTGSMTESSMSSLFELSHVLMRFETMYEGSVLIGPHTSLLLLKAFVIQLKVAREHLNLPQNLIAQYAQDVLQRSFFSDSLLYEDVVEFNRCKNYLLSVAENKMKVPAYLPGNEKGTFFANKNYVRSTQEIDNYPELGFLYQKLGNRADTLKVVEAYKSLSHENSSKGLWSLFQADSYFSSCFQFLRRYVHYLNMAYFLHVEKSTSKPFSIQFFGNTEDPSQPYFYTYFEGVDRVETDVPFQIYKFSSSPLFHELIRPSRGLAIEGGQNFAFPFQLSDQVKTSMAPSETFALASIAAEPDLVLTQLILYFKAYFERLAHPDFQALFQYYLFSHRHKNGEILDELHVQRIFQSLLETKHQLLDFLEEAIRRSAQLKWVETELFLIWNYSYLLPYIIRSGEHNAPLVERAVAFLKMQLTKLIEHKIDNNIDQVVRLVKDENLYFSSIFSYFGECYKKGENLEDICKKEEFSWLPKEAWEGFPLLLRHFKELLNRVDSLVPCWVVSMAPAFSQCNATNSLLNVCEQAAHQIHLCGFSPPFLEKQGSQLLESYERGLYLMRNMIEGVTCLPNKIIEHQEYPKLFPQNYPAKEIGVDCFEFTHDDGIQYRIQLKENQLHVYRKFVALDGKERWYRWCKDSPFKESVMIPEIQEEGVKAVFQWPYHYLFEKGEPISSDHPCSESGYLNCSTRFWISVEAPFECLVLPANQDRVVCRLTPEGILRERDPQEEKLFLYTSYPTHEEKSSPQWHKCFFQLDFLGQTLIWKNGANEIQKVELPRLNLTFDRVKNSSTHEYEWESSLHPGYVVDKGHVLKHRKDGKELILLSNFLYRSSKLLLQAEDKETVEAAFFSDPHLLTYSIDSEDFLLWGLDFAHAFYLVYFTTYRHVYDAAQKVLNKIKHQSFKWDSKISSLMQVMIESTEEVDCHPAAVSLRIQLFLFYQKHSPNSPTSQQIERIEGDYLRYLNQLNNVTQYRLSIEEELECLKLFESSATIQGHLALFLQARKNVLTGGMPVEIESKHVEAVQVKLPTLQIDFSWWTPDIAKEMVRYADKPLPIILETRPGAEFVLNFLYYYKIVMEEDSQEKVVLFNLLNASRFSRDVQVQSLRSVLLHAMIKSSPYPSFEEVKAALQEGNLTTSPFGLFLKKLEKEAVRLIDPAFDLKLQILPHVNALVSAGKNTLEPLEGPFFESGPIQVNPVSVSFAEKYGAYLIPEDEQSVHAKIDEQIAELRAFEQEIFANVQDDGPCVIREFKRYSEGVEAKIEELEIQKSQKHFQLNFGKLQEFSSALEHDLEAQQAEVDRLKTEVLKISRTYTPGVALQVHGGLIKPLEMKKLCVCLAKNDDHTILASNPSLTLEQLNQLKKLLVVYLVKLVDMQLMLRVQKSLHTVQNLLLEGEKESPEVMAEAAKLIKELCAQKAYQPSEEAILLVFEYFSNIRLKEKQVIALKTFTGDGWPNIDLEAQTGFGKSKVIIPLWLMLTSHKRPLSMMAVPASLFQDQLKHLKEILGSAFDYTIVPLESSLSEALTLSSVRELNQLLESFLHSKNKLLLTNVNTLHNLLNLASLKEILESTEESDLQLCEELLALRHVICTELALFVDESKECFDVRKRYDCAVGAPQPVSLRKCYHAMEFYQRILLSGEVLSKWNFEFLPQHFGEEKTQVTEENYPELQKLLIQKTIEVFSIPEEHISAVTEDLKGNYSEACELYFTMLSHKQKLCYEAYKKQICIYMKRALTRDCDTRYGFNWDQASRLAFPLERGNLNPNSHFSTIEDQMNFTIQANLNYKVSKKHLRTLLDQCKINLMEKKSMHKLMRRFIANIEKFLEKHLLDIDAEDIDDLALALNKKKNLNLLVQYIGAAILPSMTYHEKKISSTSFNLISAPAHIQAASGTVYPETLPPKIVHISSKSAPIDNLFAFWKSSQDHFFAIENGTKKEMLAELCRSFSRHRLLTDIAGFFRGSSSDYVATLILKAMDETVKGVSYYDDKGNFLILERHSGKSIPYEATQLSSEDIFTFIPQANVIGSDPRLPLACRGIVTMSHKIYMDHFCQGAGRMRGLSSGQHASFVFLREDVPLIAPDVDVDAENLQMLVPLYRYLTRGQGNKKAADYLFSLPAYLDDCLLEQLFANVVGKKGEELKRGCQVFKAFEKILYKNTQEVDLSYLRMSMRSKESKKIVTKLKKNYFTHVERLIHEHGFTKEQVDLEAMKTRFEAYVDYTKLAKESVENEDNEAIDIAEVADLHDASHEGEKFAEQAMDVPRDDLKPLNVDRWGGVYDSFTNFVSIGTVREIECYHSPNYFKADEQPDHNVKLRKPADQLLVAKDLETGQLKVVLFDLYDAKMVMHQMEKLCQREVGKPRTKEGYYLLSGDSVIGTDAPHPLNLEDKALRPLLILHKLCRRQKSLTEAECKYVRSNPLFKQDMTAFLTTHYGEAWTEIVAYCKGL